MINTFFVSLLLVSVVINHDEEDWKYEHCWLTVMMMMFIFFLIYNNTNLFVNYFRSKWLLLYSVRFNFNLVDFYCCLQFGLRIDFEDDDHKCFFFVTTKSLFIYISIIYIHAIKKTVKEYNSIQYGNRSKQ